MVRFRMIKRKEYQKKFPTDYSHYDVIYLADTYGVYKDDLNEKTSR